MMKPVPLLLLALFLPLSSDGAQISGFVYAPDGVVARGVRVEAFVPVTRAPLGTAQTGDGGGFVLPGLPEGVVELDIAGTNRLAIAGDIVSVQLERRVERPDSREPRGREATRPTGDALIAGVVRLDGKPLPNAPVIIQGLGSEAIAPVRVVTNGKGEYRAPGLAALRYAVVIDDRLARRVRQPHTGRMYAEGKEPFIVDLRTAREATSDIDLTSAPKVHGRVVDAEGEPVAHARVQLVIASRPVADFAHEPFVRTTPGGAFEIPLPEWDPSEKINVAVTAPLHSTVRSKTFVAGGADSRVDITLPKFESVRVRLTDRSGKPVPRARVAFTPREESADPGLLAMLARAGSPADDQGELTLRLVPDTYDFAVDAEAFQAARVTKPIVRASTVDVVLERAAIIRGRVHRGGTGVADVNVSVLGGSRRGPDTFVRTDAKGSFVIQGLAPGSYRLSIFHSEEMIERTLEVEAPADVDVSLPPAGTLRARVIDAATGEPVREFAYNIRPTEGRNQLARGEQSAEGTFVVTLPEGTYTVTAGASGFTSSDPMEVRIAHGEPASIVLPLGRGVTITGRVTDDAGAPVAGADVMVIGREAERMRTRSSVRVAPGHAKTTEDGGFTITGVDRGEAQMNVRKDGYVPFRKPIDADGVMTIDVRLSRGLSVRGIVMRGGRPVAGAQVSASSAAVSGDHQPATTGDDGRFVLSGLVAARYTVSAWHDDRHAEVRDVDPGSDREIVVSLDAKPRGVIYGTVSGIPPTLGGKYVGRVVNVQGPDGGAEGTIDEAGNYRIENAPTGMVSVTAHLQAAPDTSRSSVRKQVELTPGQPLRVDLEMTGDVRVTGRLSHEGKPLGAAHIGFTTDDGVVVSTLTRDDGAYDVALPAPGRYHVYARADQLSDRHFSTVRDIRSGDRIDIDLREHTIEGVVLDALTRQPVAGALVSFGAAEARHVAVEVPTDPNGRFRISTSSTGSHRLTASAPGYAYRVLPVTGSTPHYTFELMPAAELRVRVSDARSGTPLDAHLVVTEDDGTFVPVRLERSTDGTTYRFSLAPAKYRLTVVVQGYENRVLEVSAPGAVDVGM
jgi:protocatechuate 3,4-dioxygenase beta subunit